MKRLAVLLCALAVGMTGCSSLLEREYSSSSRHMEYPVNEDTSNLQAESYQGLVSALLYLVGEHDETGVIRLSNYLGDVEKDLDAACAEVLGQDPVGSYALSRITHQHTRIVSYYEVTLTFEYDHTAEEMSAIVPVSSQQGLSQALGAALSGYQDTCVLRLSHITAGEDMLRARAYQVWSDTPLATLERPEIQVSLYPQSIPADGHELSFSPQGRELVAEFHFVWSQNRNDLLEKSAYLDETAQSILTEIDAPLEGLTAENLLPIVLEDVELDPNGGSTPYDALVDQKSNVTGKLLALRLLCQKANVEAFTVRGRLNGEDHFWLIAKTAHGFGHIDFSQETPSFSSDSQFTEMGYEWNTQYYPPCEDIQTSAAASIQDSPQSPNS